MLKLNITGTLGKFGYQNIPEKVVESILMVAIDTALITAKRKAPVDPRDPPIHIRDELQKEYDNAKMIGYVYVKLPYANIAEFGSKHRLPHPYMRPAAQAARNKMRAVIRASAKKAIQEEKIAKGIR
jgi:HK97 gp10 family phage protein